MALDQEEWLNYDEFLTLLFRITQEGLD